MRFLLIFTLFFNIIFALNLGDILKNLKTDNISGRFLQTKKMAGFDEIKMRGEFALKDAEFLQTLSEPIPMQIKVNKNGIFELHDGKEVPIDSLFNGDLFLDLVHLNVDKLKRDFDYSLSELNGVWEITLTPKNIIKKVFKSIIISGQKSVQKIELLEQNGDLTIYEFEI